MLALGLTADRHIDMEAAPGTSAAPLCVCDGSVCAHPIPSSSVLHSCDNASFRAPACCLVVPAHTLLMFVHVSCV